MGMGAHSQAGRDTKSLGLNAGVLRRAKAAGGRPITVMQSGRGKGAVRMQVRYQKSTGRLQSRTQSYGRLRGAQRAR